MSETNKNKKISVRLAAAAICVVMLLCMMPTSAFALEGKTGDLNWSLWGGTLLITGKGAMPDYTDAFMPPWYGSAEAINKISVGSGVTSIGSLAFYGCVNASVAKLPEGLVSIGDRSFKNCTSLKYMNLPTTLESIGEAAFESCESLNGVVLPGSLKTIGNYAFMRCTSLTSITVPPSVENFGMVVFAFCTNLTRVNMRCPISKIPDWSFYGCTALDSLLLPATVVEAGDSALHDCSSLNTVYFTGENVALVENIINSDPTIGDALIIGGDIYFDNPQPGDNGENGDDGNGSTGEYIGGESGNSYYYDTDTDTGITVTVSDTDNSIISKKTETEYEYTVNGNDATQEDVLNAGENDDVEVKGKTSQIIDAVINNDDGWQELIDVVDETIRTHKEDDNPINVNIQLNDSVISGQDISEIINKDVVITVITDNGNTWVINGSENKRSSFDKKKEYDLDYTVTRLKENNTSIPTDQLYQVMFSSDIDFKSTVGINVKVGNAYKYATLYQKVGSKYEGVQTVVVDKSGQAWFSLANIDKGVKYYVGINSDDADIANAIIPESPKKEYGMDQISYLTDSNGMQYEITGRTSKWGITGGRFAVYVGAAIAVLVLIVAVIMITINKLGKSKTKYAVANGAPDADLPIDEEALRMQVMKEMLEEKESGAGADNAEKTEEKSAKNKSVKKNKKGGKK